MPPALQEGMHEREVVEWLQTDTNLVGCIERKARVVKARSYGDVSTRGFDCITVFLPSCCSMVSLIFSLVRSFAQACGKQNSSAAWFQTPAALPRTAQTSTLPRP
jgi:hypothetical protein